MKKLTALLTAFALLGSNAAFAQSQTAATPATGKAASAGKNTAYGNGFAWGIFAGGLIVFGVVIGCVCGMAAGNNSH